MRVTIVPADSVVIVDGIAIRFDFSVATNIHAVQWDGTAGEVEFKTIDGEREPNLKIEDLFEFQSVIDGWQAEFDKAAAEAAAVAALAAAKPTAPVNVIAN